MNKIKSGLLAVALLTVGFNAAAADLHLTALAHTLNASIRNNSIMQFINHQFKLKTRMNH